MQIWNDSTTDLIGEQVITPLYSLTDCSTPGTSKILGYFFEKTEYRSKKTYSEGRRDPIDLYTDINKHLLRTSVGASIAPSVANVPIIGWVTMLGGNQGADIGGGVVKDLSKNSQLQNKTFLLK